jgi:cyclase
MAGAALPKSRHFTLHQIADGVYAGVATEKGWAVGNAGIIDLGNHTLVFDAFANHLAAAELKEAAERLTGRKVDYVLLSHAHRDHVKGTQVFGDASVIATRATREIMTLRWKDRSERVKEEGFVPIREEIEAEFEAWMANPATTKADKVLWESYKQAILQGIEDYNLKLPDESFEASMKFQGSKRTAEAMTFGGGHSASDAILYLPNERVAYLGDLLFIGYQPFIADGDPKELLTILDKIEALDPRTLVPGHGPVGSLRDIQPMREYVLSLLKIVDEVRASGGDQKEAMRRPIPEPFRQLKWGAFWGENLDFLFQRGPKTS